MQGDKYSEYACGSRNKISAIALKLLSSSRFLTEANLVLTSRYIFNITQNCRTCPNQLEINSFLGRNIFSSLDVLVVHSAFGLLGHAD